MLVSGQYPGVYGPPVVSGGQSFGSAGARRVQPSVAGSAVTAISTSGGSGNGGIPAQSSGPRSQLATEAQQLDSPGASAVGLKWVYYLRGADPAQTEIMINRVGGSPSGIS
ncbi:unnamed protein product [Protopolystoma xenopodis]|uniref:Uncharacterized protein n=1 Tax=Protopolystoma xenopodis TaxID=117903 RepID=A0A448XFL3_9PLAT|nr:unnamed protein product [Protopolystoma xenopodis]